MAYLGKTPSQAVRQKYTFTATGGETSISGADDSSNTLSFTDGEYVDVYLNGVLLVAGTDYNTTTANTIGGLSALSASDVVEIVVYDTFSVFGGDVQGDLTISNGDLNITDITAKDSNGIQFNTDEGTERARIDDSGNLLVGTTDSTPYDNSAGTSADNGIALRSDGLLSTARYNGILASFNRTGTADGDVVRILKDGATVGSIGVDDGDLYIGTGVTGLGFFDTGNRIIPFNTSTGSFSDNTTDLGDPSFRFQDLYLSGGIYLGGTGSANYLDDYEEGTWTPTVTTGTVNAGNARYTKVGNLVTVMGNLTTFSDRTTGADIQIGGLPFTTASDNRTTGAVLCNYVNRGDAGFTVFSSQSLNYLSVYAITVGGNFDPVQHNHLNSNSTSIYFTISYRA